MPASAPSSLGAFLDAQLPDQTEFLAELVRIPTDNPPGDCAAHAAHVRARIEAMGYEVYSDVVPPDQLKVAGMISVTNLIVRRHYGSATASRPGPVIALNAHGDVVPPGRGWKHDPYGADIIDDAQHGPTMVGRGVAVSKSDFATYLWALRALDMLAANGARFNGTVELHLTYDEECGGNIGPARLLAENLSRPDYAISAGFSYAVTTAHNGCLHLEVVLQGLQAHAAMPHTGHDALEAASGVLQALYGFRKQLAQRTSSVPGITHATLNVGLIHGGINTNVVPDEVTLRIDRRMIPEEAGHDAAGELETLIRDAAAAYPGITVNFRTLMLAEPLVPLPGHERLADSLSHHAQSIFGTTIAKVGVPLYTDARHYTAQGIPTVLYGAGPRSVLEACAHGANENLRLNDLRRATEVIVLTLADLLGQPEN